MTNKEKALEMHKQWNGKLSVEAKCQVASAEDLAIAYTPGVAEPCRAIAKSPKEAYTYTIKSNTVAVVSDGSAVLGLGNIGALAAMPVMEGKAALFKEFGGVNAFPICLDTQDTEEIIETVVRIAPAFGGINLEDIAAPRCFEIEERLDKMLDIPVFHDDQHGTAIACTAAVLGAMRLMKKDIHEARIIVNGAGAAGTAIARLLLHVGAGNVTMLNSKGAMYEGMDMSRINRVQAALLTDTNREKKQGKLAEIAVGADVLIGVSVPGAFTPEIIQKMRPDPVVLSLCNPVPEISYAAAKAAGAKVVGTGRSDTPNQVNNVLVFPGLFRGAIDVRAREINDEMKLAAAYAIADLIPDDELREDYVIPDVFNPRTARAVAAAVAKAAIKSGAARTGMPVYS